MQGKQRIFIGAASTMLLLFGLIPLCLSQDVIDAAPYLREGAGARSLGMANAFTALADDPTASIFNPAGLPGIRDIAVTVFTAKTNLDRKHNFFGLTKNFGQTGGTIGLAWTNAGVDDIPSYGADGTPGEKFNYSANAFVLAYGYAPNKDVSVGTSVRVLTDRFDKEGEETDLGFGGVDIGGIGHLLSKRVSIGLVGKNLGGKLADGTVSPRLDVGVAVRVLEQHQAVLALDVEHELVNLAESSTSFRLGAEFWLANVFAIRGGGQHTGDRRSLFAGFGVKVSGLQLDYAFRPTDDTLHQLGDNTHFVSLSYNGH